MSRFIRSMSLEVVSPLRGSTVRPNLRSTTLHIPSSTRRRMRSGSASSRRFFSSSSSLSFPVGSSESVMNSQYEFYRAQFKAHAKGLKLERPVFQSAFYTKNGFSRAKTQRRKGQTLGV